MVTGHSFQSVLSECTQNPWATTFLIECVCLSTGLTVRMERKHSNRGNFRPFHGPDACLQADFHPQKAHACFALDTKLQALLIHCVGSQTMPAYTVTTASTLSIFILFIIYFEQVINSFEE